MPKVSVLMTAYNREKYIAEAIQSVLNSSFSDFELIIVDDQSSDKTFEIAREYMAMDARIFVYKNEKNLGDYPNRNKAASYANGKYLKYLDADDTIYAFSLEYMIDAMESFPEAGLAISYNKIDDSRPYPHVFTPQEAIKNEYLNTGILGCGPSAAIIRKDIFKQLNGFSGEQYLGDHELWLRIAEKFAIVKIQPSLVWWRQHPDQQMHEEKKNILIRNRRFHFSFDRLKQLNNFFTEKEFQQAEKNIKKSYARNLLKELIRGDIKVFFTLWRLSKLSFFEILSGFRK